MDKQQHADSLDVDGKGAQAHRLTLARLLVES